MHKTNIMFLFLLVCFVLRLHPVILSAYPYLHTQELLMAGFRALNVLKGIESGLTILSLFPKFLAF